MKHLLRGIIAVFLSVLMAALLPVQVYAEKPDYISELKVGMGKTAGEAKAALKGYIILDTDLNQSAEGGFGSKGEKAVFLGYKTTKNADEAVTDLALMNMKGGYSVPMYDNMMDKNVKEKVEPFINGFLTTVSEYRENYYSKNSANSQRARYIYNALNKFYDDDTGKGLGDLLLNETKYEMGEAAYNALSDKEKKEHADIVTIIAQSNGKATLMMENLLTRSADTDSTNWFERFSETTYDNMLNATGKTPTDARKALAKRYDDDAQLLCKKWDELYEELQYYDAAVQTLKDYDEKAVNAAIEAYENIEDINNDKEKSKVQEDHDKAVKQMIEAMRCTQIVLIHDTLKDTTYADGGNMREFFMHTKEEVEADTTMLYPLVASLSDGQREGLEFVTMRELFTIAFTKEKGYKDVNLDILEPLSIYDGVDRDIYKSGGVALTSDALRNDVEEIMLENASISGWTTFMVVFTGVAFMALAVTLKMAAVFKSKAVVQTFEHECMVFVPETGSFSTVKETFTNNELEILYSGKSAFCKSLALGIGFGVAFLTAVTIVMTFKDMAAHYNVEFTPIPHYIIDEKDLLGYNEKGERIVLKNQTAYYKVVECNRSEKDEFFNTVGTCSDLNGDVGAQWLALYAVKNEMCDPILASSLKAVVNQNDIPPGYQTGIHMFGTDTAFNLNSSPYVWNKDAAKVQIYFKCDKNAKSTEVGSNFTSGSLALSSCCGLIIGAFGTWVVINTVKKKKSKAENAP